jgi:hypothetical protein
MSRRFEIPVQPDRDRTRSGQEPQEGPHDRDNLLHRDSSHAGVGLDNKGLQIAGLDFREAPRIVIKSEEPEEIAGYDAMAQNRRGGEATHSVKVFAIGIQQSCRRGWGWNSQSATLMEVLQQ